MITGLASGIYMQTSRGSEMVGRDCVVEAFRSMLCGNSLDVCDARLRGAGRTASTRNTERRDRENARALGK